MSRALLEQLRTEAGGRQGDRSTRPRQADITRKRNQLSKYRSGRSDELPGHYETKRKYMEEEYPPEDIGLGDLFSLQTVNEAGGDIKEFVDGMGLLLGMAGKGAYKGGKALFTGDTEELKRLGGSMVEGGKEFGKAIIEDYKRYIDDPVEKIHRDPLFFLMDVSGLGSLAGIGGKMTAKSLPKVSKVLKTAEKYTTPKGVGGVVDKKLMEKSPSYAAWQGIRAEKKSARELMKKWDRAHYALRDQDRQMIHKMFEKIPVEDQGLFIYSAEGLIPWDEVPESIKKVLPEYREIVNRESAHLVKEGVLKEGTPERVRWQPLMQQIAKERGLIGDVWVDTTLGQQRKYHIALKKREKYRDWMKKGKDREKTKALMDTVNEELKQYNKDGSQILRTDVTLDDLSKSELDDLRRAAEIRRGIQAPVKRMVREMDEQATGAEKLRYEQELAEQGRERLRPATPEEIASRETALGEIDELKAAREQIIDDYLEMEIMPEMAEKGVVEKTGKAALPRALQNIGYDWDTVQKALQTKKGTAYNRIRERIDETLREGRRDKHGEFMVEPDEGFVDLARRIEEHEGTIGKVKKVEANSMRPTSKGWLSPRGKLHDAGAKGEHIEVIEKLVDSGEFITNEPLMIKERNIEFLNMDLLIDAVKKGWVSITEIGRHLSLHGNEGTLGNMKNYVNQRASSINAVGVSLIETGTGKTRYWEGPPEMFLRYGVDREPTAIWKHRLENSRPSILPKDVITKNEGFQVSELPPQKTIAPAKTVYKEVEKTIWETVEDAAEREPIYFQHWFLDKDDKMKYARHMRQQGPPSKPYISAFRKRKGAEGYEVANPQELFEMHRADIRRFEETLEAAKEIQAKHAKPFDGENLIEGYVPYDWDFGLKMFKSRIDVRDELIKRIGLGGKKGERALAKLVTDKQISEEVRKTLQDAFTRKGPDSVIEIMRARFQKPQWQIPKAFHDELQNTVKKSGAWVQLWDTATGWWKFSVLRLFPRWTYNDMFGNLILNTMAGIGPKHYLRLMKKAWRDKVPWDAVGEGFVETQKRIKHAGAAAEHPVVGKILSGGQALAEGPVGKAVKATVGRIIYPIADFNTKMNKWINNVMRGAHYLKVAEKVAQKSIGKNVKEATRMQAIFKELDKFKKQLKVFDPEIGAKSIDDMSQPMAMQAIEQVNYWLNDWVSGLNPFERRVISRYFSPFYSWHKHVFKIATHVPIDYPGRTMMLKSWMQAANQAFEEEDKEYLPRWLRDTVKIAEKEITKASGERVTVEKRLRTSSVNPLKSITEATEGVGMLHPAIQSTISALFGIKPFGGRKLTSPDVDVDFLTGEQYKTEGTISGRPERIEKIPFLDALLPQLIKAFPQGRYADKIQAGGSTYDTSIPLIRNQPRLDRETGEPQYPNQWIDEIIRYFGPSVTTVEGIPEQKRRAAEGERRVENRQFNEKLKDPEFRNNFRRWLKANRRANR